MRNVKVALQAGLALALLALMAFGVYEIIALSIAALSRLRSDLAVAIVAGSATVVVSVVSVIVAKALEVRARLREEMRAKKVPVYEAIITTLFRLFLGNKPGVKPMSEKELAHFFVTTTQQLTVWGSDEVLTAYRAFRVAAVTSKPPVEGMLLLEALMFAIRKDLGHKNSGLTGGHLLSLFINDIDTALAEASVKPASTQGPVAR